MYDNIGKKIKGLAKATFIVEAIIPIIAGVIIMGIDEDTILTGFLVAIIGPIIAWVSSWLLYGFGELIEKVCDIEKHFRNNKNQAENSSNKKVEKSSTEMSEGTMEKCDFCEKNTEVHRVKIIDNLGVRYRKLCKECIEKTEQEGSVIKYDPS